MIFFTGFTIFSVLGNLANELNVPIETVIKSGQGLAFISYPTAIAKFDYVPQVAKHLNLNHFFILTNTFETLLKRPTQHKFHKTMVFDWVKNSSLSRVFIPFDLPMVTYGLAL